MALMIYNSLTRTKEEFTPLVSGHVGMYVCGPTVYSHSHIGHGKSYVSFDIIVRYLRFCGYNVLYVQNITDVGHLLDDGEDRMLKQSKIEKIHPMQIAENITRSYFEDMDALNILRPDISPRATGHIIEQIEIVKELLAKGFAYEVNGSVYFDVRKAKGYGKLSGRKLEEAAAGTRVDVRDEKRSPEDFALWKRADSEHIMRWPSPWGEGFPGWHVECSAMSMKYLGETFDIHGGGLDNQFPHHECEIAQSESATGKTFVRYWIHNNLVTVNGQKMSKSLGNFTTLKDAFKNYNPLVMRFFILQCHYRSTLDFSDEALAGAKAGYDRLKNFMVHLREAISNYDLQFPKGQDSSTKINGGIEPFKLQFQEAMNDDFNTPRAIAVLFNLVSEVNVWLNSELRPSKDFLLEIETAFSTLAGKVLGILPTKTSVLSTENHEPDLSLRELLGLLVDVRNEVRKNKLWGLSDLIRDRLKSLGYVLEDKKEGTSWKRS
ncbi:MAG: cysteine--tRNA ligase [Ignavibacteriales bacterium]|nr:cysteine--tRNA ligase [Ignavibacteriales bacterium]